MDGGVLAILTATVSVAFFHTLLGPDHTLPFVMLSRARRWSLARTLAITMACGLAHVASSLALGGVGVALGWGVGRVEAAEAHRGNWAVWALIGFGMAYALWGARRSLQRRRGIVVHRHHGRVHAHGRGDRPHDHENGAASTDPPDFAFWALLLIFVLGPCEPLIPLFMVPAARGDDGVALLTATVFTLVTLATMAGCVAAGCAGYERLRLPALERWSETLAGVVVAASGVAILCWEL